MKRRLQFLQYKGLSAENISAAIAAADTFMNENGIDRRKREAYKLLLEDSLLDYAEKDGQALLRVIMQRSYKKVFIQLRIRCESLNVTDEDKGVIRETILSGMEEKPKWKYFRGENRLTFTVKVIVPDKKALKHVLQYMESEKAAFRTGVLLRVINMVLLVTEPLLAALIITAFNGNELHRIVLIAISIAVLEAASSLINYIASRALTKAYTVMQGNLQASLARNILKIKTEHMDNHSSGVFVERLTSESESVVNGIDEMLAVLTESVRLASLLAAFAIVSPVMLLFAVVLFVCYYFVVNGQSKVVSYGTRRVRMAKEKLNGFVVEMVKANRDIKVHHCEESLLLKAQKNIMECSERTQEVRKKSNLYILFRTQFVAWTDLLYLIALVIMMANYGMTPATALILYNYNGKAYASARAVSGAAASIHALLLAAERIHQLMESPDFAHEEFGKEKLEKVRGDIELRDVHFGYRSGRKRLQVLSGLNMHIRPGECVAFVGRSGCGKSTVLSLIERLYDPEKGAILLDGVGIERIDRDSLRGNIGMVTQMPYLFNMSIRDNFATIRKDITDEEIIQACKTVCIHADIMKFSEGYDTVIGEGGIMLSGGQRQRLALARCLTGNYPIIFLDEATSALDNETQAKIQAAIEQMEGKTVIMVAHRLSTVVNCDRLFFLSNGKVLASGTHRELLENCPEYRKLYGEEAAENRGNPDKKD